MSILEIAKASGFRTIEFNGSKHTDITSVTPVFTVELTRFAAAVIEDYKSKLVPVAWMKEGGSVCSAAYKADGPQTRLDKFYKIPLYALPLGEMK